MISNAIPGITNVNTYVNTQSAKGIAVKQSTGEFQKTLTTASAENKAAELTNSFSRTLKSTVSNVTDNKAEVKTEKQSETGNEDTKVKATDEQMTDTEVKVKESQEPSETTETTEIREDATETLSEEITEGAPQIQPEIAEVSDELGTALEDAAAELMQQLADELGLDIEDIENAMETLGLTNIAILDPTNMTQIIGELTGADDVMEIVTNADVYMNVQNMQDAVDTSRQELMQGFDLTEEDLSSALENFGENPDANVNQQEAPVNPFNEQAVVLETQTVQQPSTDSAVRVEINDLTDGIVTEIPEEVVEMASESKESGADTTSEQNTDGGVFNQMMNQISSSLSEVSETEMTQQMSRANTEQIMEQITEFIRVNVKAETTSLELQMHPASLGTVNVMIEQAKDGNMIAKFMTQNEDVRAAIEGQLQMLQEKFNEQGIKVTAVEVAVNANGFDQTLNDSQSQKEDDQDAQESVRKPMRRIRLEDLSMEDGEIPEISEEDQLTAQMMAINGNSVDFSA